MERIRKEVARLQREQEGDGNVNLESWIALLKDIQRGLNGKAPPGQGAVTPNFGQMLDSLQTLTTLTFGVGHLLALALR